jgi:hypothetical protein
MGLDWTLRPVQEASWKPRPRLGLARLTCLSVWHTMGVSLFACLTLETGEGLIKQAHGRHRISLFIDVAW